MTIRCLAIDDEPLALKQIGLYINKTPFLELAGLCNSAYDALEYLSSEKVDLLFVDINMPDLTGMDFVKSLRDKPYVVFTTAYSEYAIEGFKVDAVDYLLKPIGYSDFLKSANKVKSLFELKENLAETTKSPVDHIFVKADYKLIRVDLNEIKFIESMHEYVRIHLLAGKPVMTHVTMKSIEQQLPTDKFMRVHRSYIVNLEKVKVVERNRIVFENSVYIPVSEQYKEKFQAFIDRKFLQ